MKSKTLITSIAIIALAALAGLRKGEDGKELDDSGGKNAGAEIVVR